jgi:hypothetical protein
LYGAGRGVEAHESFDLKAGGGELDGVLIGGEAGGGFAAEGLFEGVEGDALELDAEEVGGGVAEVFDTVAFGDAGCDAIGALDGRRADDGLDLAALLVVDADLARVVEVDEDGGEGGVVVDGNLLMRAVVGADDGDVGVVEDRPVVVREGDEGVLRARREGSEGDGEE